MENAAFGSLLATLREAAPGALAVGLTAGAPAPGRRGALLLWAFASGAGGFACAALASALGPDSTLEPALRAGCQSVYAAALAAVIVGLSRSSAPEPGPPAAAALGLSFSLSGGLQAGSWLRSAPLDADRLWALAGGGAGAAIAVALAAVVAAASGRGPGASRIRLALLIALATLAAAASAFALARAELISLRGTSLWTVERLLRFSRWILAGVLWAAAALPAGHREGRREGEARPRRSGGAELRLAMARRRRDRGLRVAALALAGAATAAVARGPSRARGASRYEPPTVLEPKGALVSIPTQSLADGRLHRFATAVGTRWVRFLARRNGDGTYSTAFDACLVCGETSYVEERRGLVCLACRSNLDPASLGREGGCNPIPLRSVPRGGAAGSGRLEIRIRDLQAESERFRAPWRPEAVDPVCRMALRVADAAATAVYEGRTYRFCRMPSCHAAFLRDPGRYAAR